MTKQQYLTASKLFMELSELFKQAGETLVEESHVIAPLVEKPIEEVSEVEVIEPVITETIEEEMPDNVISLDMTIQQLRAKAKELGLSTKGTKKDLVARITESLDTEDEVEDEIIEAEIVEDEEIIEDEDVEEEIEDEDVEIEDEDVEIEDEEDEVEEDEELSHMEVIQAELESMSLEELQEVLESVELPTKGKKQALISRILDAVEEGILEFEAEEEFEYDAETDYEEDEDEEFDAEIEEELEDDLEDIEIDEEDEEELSPREQTQLEVQQEIEEAYESGDLTDKEIAKFLEEYFNGRFKPINKKRAFNKYLEIQCDLVDADGERMPMKEAYYVNEDEIFCCGADINQLDNGNLYCEVCGTEYEME